MSAANIYSVDFCVRKLLRMRKKVPNSDLDDHLDDHLNDDLDSDESIDLSFRLANVIYCSLVFMVQGIQMPRYTPSTNGNG